MVAQGSSTVNTIRTRVRRLTGSPNTFQLDNNTIDQYIQTFYTQDFIYGIKLDVLKTIYTIYTIPNVDVYPLDINANQGIRAPVYFEGIQGWFFKDRDEFFRMWPRFPNQSQPINGDGTTQQFTFTISPVPFLRNNVVMGGTDNSGNAIRVTDDGNGNLNYVVTDSLGDQTYITIGSVNYVTGNFTVDFSLANVTPAAGTQVTLWVSPYTASRPYTLLFWNNQFTVRPVPDNVYKIEVESYLTPSQFLNDSDNPLLNQWWQYIALGVAIKILEDRQDMEGVQNLMPAFLKQEALVLERQGIEEIGQRNATIFSAAVPGPAWGYPQGWYY